MHPYKADRSWSYIDNPHFPQGNAGLSDLNLKCKNVEAWRVWHHVVYNSPFLPPDDWIEPIKNCLFSFEQTQDDWQAHLLSYNNCMEYDVPNAFKGSRDVMWNPPTHRSNLPTAALTNLIHTFLELSSATPCYQGNHGSHQSLIHHQWRLNQTVCYKSLTPITCLIQTFRLVMETAAKSWKV